MYYRLIGVLLPVAGATPEDAVVTGASRIDTVSAMADIARQLQALGRTAPPHVSAGPNSSTAVDEIVNKDYLRWYVLQLSDAQRPA